jgi:hypothetical protein|tara:strand:- start:945 stop:1190 length:246 start_codon:yes stop_codon:yes gene_type:complete
MPEPTNQVLAAKLDGLRELMELKFRNSDEHHVRTNQQLEQLNGQVAENTKFRVQTGVLYKFFVVVVPMIISVITFALIKYT